jgi:transcriptional regulator with GAF, ATPase, and Fis domain
LFESEFFGHVRGAFTGAHKDRIGRMQLANGGTLFLDDVGEIPMALQGKLLRALQEHEFERVGDDQTTKVDVRIIAATNRDLEEEVAAGRFREDLYYRISVFPVELPPLRNRVADIVPLAIHFLDLICTELGRDSLALTKQHAAMLQKQYWPGNVRELRNVIERAVILTKGARLRLDLAIGSASKISASVDLDETAPFLTEEEFREKEKQNLVAALRSADWHIWGPDGAAALLGIKPSTLSYRMNAFGIRKSQETGALTGRR